MSRKPRRQCRKPACSSGKGAFYTRGEAQRALERIRVERAQMVAPPPHPPPVRAYVCPECLWWHLTSRQLQATG